MHSLVLDTFHEDGSSGMINVPTLVILEGESLECKSFQTRSDYKILLKNSRIEIFLQGSAPIEHGEDDFRTISLSNKYQLLVYRGIEFVNIFFSVFVFSRLKLRKSLRNLIIKFGF